MAGSTALAMILSAQNPKLKAALDQARESGASTFDALTGIGGFGGGPVGSFGVGSFGAGLVGAIQRQKTKKTGPGTAEARSSRSTILGAASPRHGTILGRSTGR